MFAGVVPILATPFHDDEALDLGSWQSLLEFMVALGVDGVTILGVLGESNRLNDEERQTLIETGWSSYAGGGLHYLLSNRSRGRLKSAGLRVDIRAVLLSGGVTLDHARHVLPGLAAGLFVRF